MKSLDCLATHFDVTCDTNVAGVLPTPHRTAKDFVEGDEGQRKWGISGKKKMKG
jgi:hypothetical protein